MLDKTELQKLIEAPIGQKCLITDPFPADNGVSQRFQVVKKYDPKLVIPDLCGLCEYSKNSHGMRQVLVVVLLPKDKPIDFSNEVRRNELGAIICHEFGHAAQYLAGKSKYKLIRPHAYALVDDSEKDADTHAFLCGYGKAMVSHFKRILAEKKDDEMWHIHNADVPMRSRGLEYLLKESTVTKEEGTRRYGRYVIDCHRRILSYTLACSNGNFTRVRWKIRSITFGEENIISVDLFGRISGNRIWDEFKHIVAFRNEYEFV